MIKIDKPIIECDLIIIGGGIAGLTSAIYSARANLKAIILEQEVTGGLINSTYKIENFPSYKSIGGTELIDKVREQVEELGVEIQECIEIQNINLTDTYKEIETDEYIYKPKAAIVATGRKPIKLFKEDYSNVHYCSICDGSFYKDKSIICIGGGNSAVEESLYLLSLGVKHITMITNDSKLTANQKAIDELIKYDNVDILYNTEIITKNDCNNKVIEIITYNNKENKSTNIIDFSGIFTFIGQQPNTEKFNGLLTMNNGYILSDENMHTNIQGVFVAGDCRQKKYRQITTAMNDGTIAALEAENYVKNNFNN